MRASTSLFMVACLALVACQGRGSTPISQRPLAPVRVASVASRPPSAPVAAPASPTASPPMALDRKDYATPIPSGYVATLPPGVVLPTFQPLPEAGGSGRAGTPPPTLAPASPPTSLAPVRVVQNSLAFGEGELAGAVFEPGAAQPAPVSEAQVFIVSAAEPTRRAELVGASDGTFRLRGVALGEYFVRVEKGGYAADSAPTLMRLYPGYTAGYTLFYVLPDR